MNSSSESSKLSDYLDRRGWIVPANLELAAQDRERLTRTLLGVFVHVEFFSTDRLHGIPVEYFDQQTILNLARTAGEIIAVDWHADETRALQFARIKIRVAINAPLIAGNYLQTLENIPTWVTFKYERIFRACYHYGRVGHTILHCRYSAHGALNNYLDQLAFNSFGQNLPFLVDHDTHLFNHLIRTFPNIQDYRNTTIYLQPSLERTESPEFRGNHTTMIRVEMTMMMMMMMMGEE
ncbi:hypothetical protein LIER_28252 [Lithospermum erythrorhizon]|uniref:Zinc knuckle CX2CX4HX4C domain-containing protein n=1 Tax=Lithospermum erythrorhizon TaxID=34254 RepID=A0AAV3RGR5_LITER